MTAAHRLNTISIIVSAPRKGARLSIPILESKKSEKNSRKTRMEITNAVKQRALGILLPDIWFSHSLVTSLISEKWCTGNMVDKRIVTTDLSKVNP